MKFEKTRIILFPMFIAIIVDSNDKLIELRQMLAGEFLNIKIYRFLFLFLSIGKNVFQSPAYYFQ